MCKVVGDGGSRGGADVSVSICVLSPSPSVPLAGLAYVFPDRNSELTSP